LRARFSYSIHKLIILIFSKGLPLKNSTWKSFLSADTLSWLKDSEPWTQYRTLLDLECLSPEDEQMIQLKKAIQENPRIQSLVKETQSWFQVLPKRHDDARLSHYQLRMLSDMGFTVEDPQIATIVQMAKEHREEVTFAIRQALPARGKQPVTEDFDEWHSLPCDAPQISATLWSQGDRSSELQESINKILHRWSQDGGWFCHLFFVNSQFKKHGSGCMMSAIQTLEILAQQPDGDNHPAFNQAIKALEYHKELGKSLYYFGRSKKFWTLKYPFVWYNALYLGEVLSRFPSLHQHPLLVEILEWLLDSRMRRGGIGPLPCFGTIRAGTLRTKNSLRHGSPTWSLGF
jgi:hypothetical protein